MQVPESSTGILKVSRWMAKGLRLPDLQRKLLINLPLRLVTTASQVLFEWVYLPSDDNSFSAEGHEIFHVACVCYCHTVPEDLQRSSCCQELHIRPCSLCHVIVAVRCKSCNWKCFWPLSTGLYWCDHWYKAQSRKSTYEDLSIIQLLGRGLSALAQD